jgi:hypothetical protein
MSAEDFFLGLLGFYAVLCTLWGTATWVQWCITHVRFV